MKETKRDNMELKSLINENTVIYSDDSKKFQILNTLIEKAYSEKKISSVTKFRKAIEDREMLMSTGIGLGVAIPHAKIDDIQEFFVITALLKKPVVWDSIDHKPVSLVFLIGGPASKQKEYLKLLSQIIVIVKNDAKREKLIHTKDISQFIKNIV